MKKVGEMMRKAYRWLTLADYEEAKARATNNIISRDARGNISFQNGSILEENELRALSKKGDKALARLNKKAKAA
jgi:hypothetical protein